MRPQNQVKYPVTLALLTEADAVVSAGASRLRYVAERLGCTTSTVGHAARRLGYQWRERPRCKTLLNTTHVERRYVYASGCVICNEGRVVDAAHLIPRSEGGWGMVSNIVPLCPTHHRCYDNGKLTDVENDKLVAFLYTKYPTLKAELAAQREASQSCCVE